MTLEESREIIPLMESMIGQIEEQQTLMAEMILEMQNRDTQLSLMQEQNQKLQKLNSELSELLNILPNTGTYDAPEKVYDIVKAAPEPFCGMMKRIIEMRIAVPELPMEEAFAACLKEDDMELDEAQFALFMNTMYASDAYIRDYFRKAALDELLKKKIPVQLVGEGWEKYQTPYERYRTIEKPVTFDLSFEKIAREQIMLDVSPIFNRGVHDRAIAGMANRTVVLTDSNPYRCAHFKNRKDMMFYSLAKIDSLSEAAGELMENEKLRSEIRENAYQTFCAGHTWRARAKEILSWEAED